jgi:signal peptidase I
MKSKNTGGFLEIVRTVVYAVVIAIVVRTVAFEPFNIPSGSMVPTLLVGDYLFVSKYSYGYSRYSLPLGLPLFSGRILARQPQRGDVIVFKLPRDNSTDYIKRLVGLPGDRIQVKESVLYINDVAVKREPMPDYVYLDERGVEHRELQYIETLPDNDGRPGMRHRIIQFPEERQVDNTDVYTVPPGQYFMMGDHRDDSLDSRFPTSHGVGFVPFENLEGKAQFIFFSTNGAARLWEFWKWPFAIRYDRLFNGVS